MPHVTLPTVSTYGEGCVLRWLKMLGDAVRVGGPLVEVEGEKSIHVIEATSQGILKAIYAPAGAVVRHGQALCWVGEVNDPPPPSSIPIQNLLPEEPAKGRALWEATLRHTTTHRMEKSWQAPKVDLFADVSFEALQACRQQSKQNQTEVFSYNIYIAYAAVCALREMPRWNLSLTPDGWQRRKHIDIGMAVAVGDALTTVSMRDLEQAKLVDIQRLFRRLLKKTLSKKLVYDEMFGSSMTITNLGEYEISSFAALLNPPEPFILAIGEVKEKPVALQGQVVVRPMCTFCLSFDHRLIDGAPASKLLQRIKYHLEHFEPENA